MMMMMMTMMMLMTMTMTTQFTYLTVEVVKETMEVFKKDCSVNEVAK